MCAWFKRKEKDNPKYSYWGTEHTWSLINFHFLDNGNKSCMSYRVWTHLNLSFLTPLLLSCVLQSWTGPEKLLALDELIDSCEPTQVKHMMQVIEPQFQRDFISLLPKEVQWNTTHVSRCEVSVSPERSVEPVCVFVCVCVQLALYVLTFLAPRDLLQAAQTCRYWRILAEDNLLWREKCREEGKHTSLLLPLFIFISLILLVDLLKSSLNPLWLPVRGSDWILITDNSIFAHLVDKQAGYLYTL